MRRFTLLFGLLAALFPADGAQGQGKPVIDLPKEPTTAVITLDHQGGGLLRKNKEPLMIIRADGTVNIGDPFGIGKRIEAKIPVVEVQALLRFAIHDNQFFDFDADKARTAIQEEMQKTGKFSRVSGAATTIIGLQTAAKEHEAKYYALATFARQFPNIKSLSQLEAVEKRLMRVMYETIAGGKEEVGKLLTIVNERLKREYPDAGPLTAADLMFARWQGQETLVIRFFREGPQKGMYVNGQVTRPAKGEAEVFVKAKVK